MNLTYVKQRLDLDADDTAHDLVLSLLLDAAKVAADTYCANPFTTGRGSGSGGGGAVVIPAPVELWVLSMVTRFWTNPPNGAATLSVASVQSITWGDVDYTLLRPFRKVKFC